MKEIWVEKYRPKIIKDFVWMDSTQRKMVEGWISERYIPHLLFGGGAGTGKTTLAKILVNELKVEQGDFLQINASRESRVDETIRGKITNFGQTMPYGDFKVILLDEADFLSQNAQAALRGVMEQYADTLRFILTCNYPHKIIPAIHSRCQGFNFKSLDETDYTARVGQILAEEGVDFDIPLLQEFVKANYPDLRKTINQVQQNSISGTLTRPRDDSDDGRDYKLEIIALFRQKQYRKAREMICKQINLDEYTDMYKFLYRNTDFWGENEDKQDEAIMIIRKGLMQHGLCSDPEINLSATLVELERLSR